MKILFLTRYPVDGASSRYRVYQYLRPLEKLGVTYEVSSFMSPAMYRLSFSRGRTLRKITKALGASLRRLWLLRRYREFDVVYMQRELFPFGPPVVERWLKKRGAVLVYDYDDALFIYKPSEYSKLISLLRAPGKVLDIFALSDCVMAGNRYLAAKAAEHAPRAEVFEVAEDTDRIPPHAPHSNEGGLVIGWLGSKTTAKYLHLIAEVLRDVVKAHPEVQIEVVGAGDFEIPGLNITRTDWSLEGELAALARFDIGIMPLPLEEWSEGKSGGKARTYMAAGVVPVVADIGYNRELIREGETGFLCRTNEEWRASLERTIKDAALRQRVATAARQDVINRFPVAGQAARMVDILQEVVAEKTASDNYSTPALVLGHSPTGLYAIRELGRAGVPMMSSGDAGQAATRSRYLSHGPKCITEARDEERLKAILSAGRGNGTARIPLIATSDQDIDFVHRHRSALMEHYAFQPSFSDGVAGAVLDKERFYPLCRENSVIVPEGWDVARDEVAGLADKVSYPCLIKPSLIHAVKGAMAGKKLFTAQTREEFVRLAANLPKGDTSWLVQEIVPGPDSQIMLFCAYLDGDGAAHQVFTARKLRQYPPGFGSASLVISEWDPEMAETSLQLLRAIGYRGIAATEFKRDPRDGKLKVIESNPRPSLWFSVAEAAGKRPTLAAYCDMAGYPMPRELPQKDGVLWRYGLKDRYSERFYRRNPDFVLPAPELPPNGAVKTRLSPVYTWDDPLPLQGDLTSMARKGRERFVGRPKGPGTFVISLDFELMWGVRDKRSVAEYGDAILGGRKAIPEMLDLFQEYGIKATWATVGLLFARDRDEMLAHAPSRIPAYENARLSPYEAIRSEIGNNENDDPYHFGRSLVDRIMAAEGQEIAAHTYSHYYTMEPGQSLDDFDADIAANVSIAREAGISLKSIVFPRNQMTPEHIAICQKHGITNWRGNPQSILYRERSGDAAPTLIRGLRLADSLVPLDGMHGHRLTGDGNIPASRFFRRTGGAMSNWQLARIKAEMTSAARAGRLYHLWWHPHNFGRGTGDRMAALRAVLERFRALQEELGMESRGMSEA